MKAGPQDSADPPRVTVTTPPAAESATSPGRGPRRMRPGVTLPGVARPPIGAPIPSGANGFRAWLRRLGRIFPVITGRPGGATTSTRRITLVLVGLAAVTLLSTGTLTAVGTVRLRSAPLADTTPFLNRPATPPRVVVPDSDSRPGQPGTDTGSPPQPQHRAPAAPHRPHRSGPKTPHHPNAHAAARAKHHVPGLPESAHRPAESAHGPAESAHRPAESAPGPVGRATPGLPPRGITGTPPTGATPAIHLPPVAIAIANRTASGVRRTARPTVIVTIVGLPLAPAPPSVPATPGPAAGDRTPARTAEAQPADHMSRPAASRHTRRATGTWGWRGRGGCHRPSDANRWGGHDRRSPRRAGRDWPARRHGHRYR